MKVVRYTKRFDWRPRQAVVIERNAGDELTITEAEFAEADAAGAVEVLDVKGPKSRAASAKAGGAAEAGKGDDRAGD